MMLRQNQFGAKGTATGDDDHRRQIAGAVSDFAPAYAAPSPRSGATGRRDEPAPACAPSELRRGEPARAQDEVLSIALPASVALILRLITEAKGVTADEAIARGICVYAAEVGIPTLARESAQDFDHEFRSGGP